LRKPDIGKVVVVLMPNGFTLLNLCLGMLAIIYAFAGDFEQAGICVVVGGVCDALDGRVARATRTGSRFGEELDSLVDIVSFGVAPAMIMYSAVLKDQTFGWLWPFIFIAAAAIRLAKFNVEQAGRKKTHFFGLPSPAAGMTLATYFWFRETPLYMESWLSALPWQQTMQIVMVVLAVLMMSNVQYAAVPTIGLKSVRGLLGTLVVLVTLVGVAFFPRQFFFPALITYVAYGLLKTAVAGLLGLRLSFVNNGEAAVEEVLPGETAITEESPAAQSGPLRFRGGRRGRRRRRGGGRGGGGGGSGGSGGPSGGTP
jgi:CDP-diacylglycerol--serine O-phosphatidyltransferase